MTDIFNYSDYRNYLEDYYKEQKQKDKKFSHRYFAQKAGINSSGFFSDVIAGKRNLTPALILKFSKALKLKRNQEEYFEFLVNFNQSTSLEEKNHYYEKMLSFKNTNIKILEKEQHEFYSTWYFSAIRELLYFYKFKDNFKELARKLNPPIREDQAKKAIQVLEKCDLIRKDKNGYYYQTSAIISSGNDFKSMNVANFQLATIDLAKDAIRGTRKLHKDRSISTVTLTLSKKSYESASEKIAKLRKDLLALAEQDKAVDRVYQMNFQIFPLTRIEDGL